MILMPGGALRLFDLIGEVPARVVHFLVCRVIITRLSSELQIFGQKLSQTYVT